MSLFLLISIPPRQQATMASLKEAVARQYPNDSLELGTGQWLVSDDATAPEVYARLTGGPEVNTIGAVVVGRLAGYYGFASTNIWEWMATKGTPKHAGST